MQGPASDAPQIDEKLVRRSEGTVLSFRLSAEDAAAVPVGIAVEPAAVPTSIATGLPPVAPAQVSSPLSGDERTLGLSPGDRWFLLVVGGAILLLTGLHWALLSGWGMQPVEISRLPARRFDYRIEINRATWVEWMQLDGIGELTARAIVADREANGPFASIEDVMRVKGIGPKTLEAMRPWLDCPDCVPDASTN